MNSPAQTATARRYVPLARPWIDDDEAAAAAEVVRSGWLISGPKVEAFERAFAAQLGAAHAVAVNSGSSALLVALAAMGIGPGDEVLAPDMTFVATASAALFLGARPVFVDINLTNYCMAAEDIERRITPRTRAIVPVHYAGQSADMDEILAIARARGIMVLEDAAESHLARYRQKAMTGTMGDAGIFSFTPSKLMTTGEGGMIMTNDAALAQCARLMRNFGDTGKFQWDGLGFNFRMAEALGAIGLVQLARLEECVARRRAIALRYEAAFREVEGIIVPAYRHLDDINFQLYTIRLALEKVRVSRDRFIAELEAAGVGARLYYPALHRQKVFAGCAPGKDAEYPNALTYEASALSLPIFAQLTAEEQDYVIEQVTALVRKHSH